MIPFLKRKTYQSGYQIGQYKVMELIGEGRFGICYLVNCDNSKYILKEIKPKTIKKSGDKIIFEQEILSSIDHSSIPKIIDTIKTDNIYSYILEYKSGTTIEDMIFGDNYIFTPEEIYKIGIKIINIIKYLHERNIVHRDISVSNVIINEEDVYLIDFGLARFINNEKYAPSVDFSYLGKLLLHLYYTSFKKTNKKSKPWYNELQLSKNEMNFLKKLFCLDNSFKSINEIERDSINLQITQL